jgi:hypothetical protein
MAHSTFGPQWPNCARANIVTLARKDGLRLPIHHSLVELVAILIDLTEMMGYDVRPDWTWGFACRPIANTKRASNHSSGTAVDINAPVNPRKSPLTTNLPKRVVDLWKSHGFRWGGDYPDRGSSVPDPMHFEFMGTTYEAGATTRRLKDFLGASGGPVQAPVVPPPQLPGSAQVERIRELQRLLRIVADGLVGPKTRDAMQRHAIGWRKDLAGNRNPALVSWLQRQGPRKGYNLAVDGIVGPDVNHFIVVVLGQADGICGPLGYQAALS